MWVSDPTISGDSINDDVWGQSQWVVTDGDRNPLLADLLQQRLNFFIG
jgi:hypothetical protein